MPSSHQLLQFEVVLKLSTRVGPTHRYIIWQKRVTFLMLGPASSP